MGLVNRLLRCFVRGTWRWGVDCVGAHIAQGIAQCAVFVGSAGVCRSYRQASLARGESHDRVAAHMVNRARRMICLTVGGYVALAYRAWRVP